MYPIMFMDVSHETTYTYTYHRLQSPTPPISDEPSDVVHEEGTRCTSIVGTCNGSEPFLGRNTCHRQPDVWSNMSTCALGSVEDGLHFRRTCPAVSQICSLIFCELT